MKEQQQLLSMRTAGRQHEVDEICPCQQDTVAATLSNKLTACDQSMYIRVLPRPVAIARVAVCVTAWPW